MTTDVSADAQAVAPNADGAFRPTAAANGRRLLGSTIVASTLALAGYGLAPSAALAQNACVLSPAAASGASQPGDLACGDGASTSAITGAPFGPGHNTAVGTNSGAGGYEAAAIGYSAQATDLGTALGARSNAAASNAVALGYAASATSANSVGVGTLTYATGDNSRP